ncbi:MAG: sulfatase [Candidatus Hodarchaeota archaeon]
MPDNKPNVLIIHADEHRFDTLGCYGNEDIQTPHIDSLAANGVTFSNCYSTFPVCTPSRYSLISGLYAHQHLGWTNRSTLPSGIETFPKILKKAGYKTACVGKMHYTPTYLDVGFEKMILSEQDGPGRFDDDYHRYLKKKGLVDFADMRDQVGEYRSKAPPEYRESFGTDPSILDEKDYNTTWIGDRACEIMEGWEGGGNLLMVGFIKPHHPHDAPPPWSEMYDPEALSLLPGWTDECLSDDLKYSPGFFSHAKLTEQKVRKVMAQYYAAVSQIDHHVGRMVKILKHKGLYDNTLIIYTSDHGDYVGFHHMTLKSNYMYDPLIKVPLVVKYPGSEYKGKHSDELVSIVDITATIIDGADCFIPQNLWEVVQPLDPEEGREAVFAEDNNGNYMVRDKKYKLLLCRHKKSQFFDLKADPNELNNLIDDPGFKEDINRCKALLFDWLVFNARSQLHVDHDAPVIKGDNVPSRGDGHEKEMEEYLRKKMNELMS